jgi:quercetin dioxygenase-like cupin family protein
MNILKYDQADVHKMREGAERRMGFTCNLMMTVIDFHDGPQAQPDPPHSHPHEQVSYVANGEILFLIGDDKTLLKPGDMFMVPSGVPHSIQLLTEHVRLIDCFTPLREDFIESAKDEQNEEINV